ncbi:hypothetical protein BFN03_19165 [Rhodococcus sp. WMMA185]|uniref:hypothetical protein n=1 Tax=Rhodococcus sp. WMMA185 TaxID=679318 RepID=UPI0008782A5B|nr:hypothetical protein [Rhodococcus sp. WMMA185]AOW94077.1 hypothetical protein BFN03_19165 [Rhodococcus sp. WMMA185]
MKTLLLRAIPIAGWIYLVYGAVRAARNRPLEHPLARTAWWVDAFLSIVVHAAQIPAALRADGGRRSRGATAALTMLFGMTWWTTQSPTTQPPTTATNTTAPSSKEISE